MKLVFVNDGIYSYAAGAPSAVGGAERQQWLLARTLAAKGWFVTVGVRNLMNAEERRTIDGVDFVSIGQEQILFAWSRFLAAEHPDWWYWRCADHLLGPAVEIAKWRGVQTIFSAGSDLDIQPRRALSRRPRWWPLYAWGLARTDRIFVQHRGQMSQLAPRWRAKARILPSIGGEIMSVKSHAERAQYVAWVATLWQVKRPDVLIEIARKAPTLHFVVCGGPITFMSPPGYSERIIDALRVLPNVEYRGQVAPEEAQQVIANAAVLLSTSDEEGFPNTFLQAWSSGTPVVSLSVDPDDVIKQEGIGAVSGSVERAVADLDMLMKSWHQRDEIAVRAQRYVTKTHSEADVVSAFEHFILGAAHNVIKREGFSENANARPTEGRLDRAASLDHFKR
jgi:glycosyltransferase involved in cell wall biosynthesis